MSGLWDAAVEYRELIGAVCLTLLLFWMIHRWWEGVKFFFKGVWYSFPIVGKTSKLSKDLSRDRTGWFRSERTLCADFYSSLNAVVPDPVMYDRAKSYLNKVQELGRNNLSLWGWCLIVIMVFLESLGFAYILAGWTLPGASEAIQVQGAVAIAFLISVLLVALTHLTGAEIHKRGLINKARVWWLHDTDKDKSILARSNAKVTLEHDENDDDQKGYVQVLNRLDTNARVTPGVPWIGLLTALLIILVATGAFYVRIQTQEQMLMEEHEVQNQGSFKFPKMKQGPPDLARPQAEAEKQLLREIEETKRQGGFVTYVILATIFVFLQIFGVILGLRTNFAGRESRQARKIMGPFQSRPEFEASIDRKHDKITNVAQDHLTRLQGKLQERVTSTGIDTEDREALMDSANRTFHDYLDSRSSRATDGNQKAS